MTATMFFQRRVGVHAGRALVFTLVILCVAASMTTAVVTTRATADGPNEARKADVKKLLSETWRDALHAKNAANMAKLYDPEAELLPTVKPGVWRQGGGHLGGGKIVDYFDAHFMPQWPTLVTPIRYEQVLILGKDNRNHEYASNQGLYDFHLYRKQAGGVWVPYDQTDMGVKQDDNGDWYKPVSARFTFVYKKNANTEWKDALIVQHHSSVEPAAAVVNKEGNIRARTAAWGMDLAGPFPNLAAHAKAMAQHYTADASLLPTVKDGLHGHPGVFPGGLTIEGYFLKFLQYEPVLLPIFNDDVGFAGDFAWHQGLYTFQLNSMWNPALGMFLPVPPGMVLLQDARFTFVYQKGQNADWSDAKIRMHHSSRKPPCVPADLDHSGIVGVPDLLKLLEQWGPCP